MKGYRLFEAFGLELEYMIVREGSLAVLPAADTVFIRETGWPCSSFTAGDISWSNEMMLHVIELKTTRPEKNLSRLPELFTASVNKINALLRTDGGHLLPTGSHPLMDPATDSRLWPHESADIYHRYHRIFECNSHGWSNLQSTHINLPFSGDHEFGALHAAVRFLLPLIPALCASSPVIEGIVTGWQDTRMRYYRDNQSRIPVIAGRIVPEPVYTERAYERKILRKIERAIAPHDPEGVLDKHFLNSRGAIARFDRNSIEIRVMDIQESPLADIACAALIIGLAERLCRDDRQVLSKMARFPTTRLARLLTETSRLGDAAPITDTGYLKLWGFPGKPLPALELWQRLSAPLLRNMPASLREAAAVILNRGTLAGAMLKDLGPLPNRQGILRVWGKTARCLASGTLYT